MSRATEDAPVLPWRKVFPRDRQADVQRKLLGLEGQAILENLLDAAWLNGGTLPNDEAVLALVSQAGPRWPAIGPKVIKEFFVERDGAYVNVDLLAELQEGGRRVEFNRARGRAGAAARWNAQSNASSIPQSNAGNDACEMAPYSRQPSAVQPLGDSQQKTETDASPSAPGEAIPVVAVFVPKNNGHNGNGARKKAPKVEIIAPGSWPGDWVMQAVQVWERHGDIEPGEMGKALKGLKGKHPLPVVLQAMAAFLAAGNAKFRPRNFAGQAGDWISGRNGQGQNRGQDAYQTALAVATGSGGER
jgi:uncharacterized protein YdaU (DUF1376 family)